LQPFDLRVALVELLLESLGGISGVVVPGKAGDGGFQLVIFAEVQQ
jgi:hypothetical protein